MAIVLRWRRRRSGDAVKKCPFSSPLAYLTSLFCSLFGVLVSEVLMAFIIHPQYRERRKRLGKRTEARKNSPSLSTTSIYSLSPSRSFVPNLSPGI
jgi:hypothetical protein